MGAEWGLWAVGVFLTFIKWLFIGIAALMGGGFIVAALAVLCGARGD